MLLQTKNLTKTFGGLTAIDNIDLAIKQGDIVSLIGPNGAGKTTFFNCITGIYHPSRGEIIFNGQRMNGLKPHTITSKGMARTFQNIRLFPEMTAIENVMVGGHTKTTGGIKDAVFRGGKVMSQDFFFQAEDGIRDDLVTGVQTCALPI